MSRTYAIVEVNRTVYDAIRLVLERAGYLQAFLPNGVIDMDGLAIETREEPVLIEYPAIPYPESAEPMLAQSHTRTPARTQPPTQGGNRNGRT